MQLTGIILAGGKSSRMGTDKAFLEIGGKTLLHRAVEFCQPFCDEILVSSNNPEHKVGGFRLINDEIRDCGPMGGIYSCLKQSKNEWNFVLSVDAVYVQKNFVNFLITGIQGFDVVVPIHSGKKEPLIALYHKKLVREFKLKLEAGNYKMHFLLEEVKTNFINSNHWLETYPKLFYNLNFPEDFGSEV